MTNDAIERAVIAIREANALLIGAGAGMGVDSGLPDFRGVEGFWKAYPPFRKLGLSFYDLADPVWFHRNPRQAWGFYGHRLNLYRNTKPHGGFSALKKIAARFADNYFVYTSNVDGHFQNSAFDEQKIVECHGSIENLQCAESCCAAIWPATEAEVIVDETTFLAEEPLPHCIYCGAVARPNILMFGDASWLSDRSAEQTRRYAHWLHELDPNTKIIGIELGAGVAVPSVRRELERQTRGINHTLIRVNPHESEIRGGLSIALGALEALEKIDQAFGES